ncbi:MAG TPA: hypothetical protein PKD29_05445 [Rhodocyclaceae bacterium]|nr:hypothetical protein [Rhodocyclaceae bacterium]
MRPPWWRFAVAVRWMAGAAIFLSGSAWAAIELDMDIRQVQMIGDAKDPQRQETVTGFRVALGATWSDTVGNGRREIHDYANRRIVDLDPEKKVMDDRSLYGPVAFRVMETANRRMIREVMAKAMPAGRAVTEAEQRLATEHELSLRESQLKGGTGGPALVVRDEVDGRHWSDGRRELAFASRNGFDLPERDRPSYGRWLRSIHSLHPDIVQALVAGGKVPARLEARYYSLDNLRGELTVAVKAVRVLPDDAIPAPYSAEPLPPQGPGLESALAKARAQPADGFQARRRLAERTAADALNAGRIMEGVAAVLEASIITGDGGLGSALAGHRDEIANDGAAATLMAAIGAVPKDRAAAKAQADRLRDARAAFVTPALKGVEANLRQGAGDVREAEKLLVEAVDAEPYLIGAWMDLGRLYYGQYRTIQAWRCWDAARRLAPGHPMTREIDDLEKRLAAGFPEFF